MSYKEKIRVFLAKYISKHDLQDDDDIFALGLVNSMFAMELVLFIEKEFDIHITNQDLDLANFKSINALNALVERKQSQR